MQHIDYSLLKWHPNLITVLVLKKKHQITRLVISKKIKNTRYVQNLKAACKNLLASKNCKACKHLTFLLNKYFCKHLC